MMRSQRRSSSSWAGLLCAGFVLAFAPRAGAWNAHGHMLVALLAYDALSEDKRAAAARLLEAHPRYHADLLPALPAELESDAQRSRWLFAYASTWPDIISKQPEHAHGTWHYVNLPLALHRGALTTCPEARRRLPESQRKIAQLDAERRARGEPGIPSGDSILVALPGQRAMLADRTAAPAARALALSWVLHLVGDAHQPLHGVALFTERRFVTGDRGGNDIDIRESNAARPEPRSLHRVWDELLGADTTPPGLEAALVQLRSDRHMWRAQRPASQRLDVATWIDEDCELARRDVYVPAIRDAVERFERRSAHATPAPSASVAAGSSAGSGGAAAADKPETSLGMAYFRQGAQKARERAVLAALRLAALLDSAL
jgi:hypothetical protein